MELSEYLFAEDPQHKNAVFIVGTNEPFPVGQVWRYRSEAELEAATKGRQSLYQEVEGYYVLITFVKCLDHYDHLPGDFLSGKLKRMARFLLDTRIERDKSYWKRFQRHS